MSSTDERLPEHSFRPVRISAMHRAHLALGATFKEDGDWRVVEVYSTRAEERQRTLAGVGLADTSAGGKLQLRGDAVEALLAKVAGVERLQAGTAARGRVAGAGVLACRLAPDEVLVLTGVADGVADVLGKAAESVSCAHVTDLTSGLAAVDLIGPSAPRLLATLVPVDLAPEVVPPLAVVQGELAGARAILIRLDRPRVPAFRALVAREHAAFIWEVLVHAGRPLGLVPLGAAARAALEEGH